MKKCEFLKVYNKYQPDYIVKTFYKYFSSTSKSNFKNIFTGILLILFVSGMFFCGAEIQPIGKIITLIFVGFLSVFGLIGLYVIISNRIRIFKITRKLKITLKQYNNYLIAYGSETN